MAQLSLAVFESSAQAQIVLDASHDRVLDANPAACRLLGYDREFLRTASASGLHPGQFITLRMFTEAVLEKGAFYTTSLLPRHAAEKVLRVEYLGSRLDLESAANCILIAISDLEERRRRYIDTAAEDFMSKGLAEWQRVDRVFRHIERENRLILGAAGEGIYGVNAEGKTTFVNPAAERILGWTADELLGEDMHRIIHHTHADGSTYENGACPIYAAFRDGAVHKVEDEVFWHKDGSAVWVEYTSTPIYERGVIIGAVIVFRNVTQRREADERLRTALVEVQQLRERLEMENEYLQEEIRIETNARGIVGRSEAIQAVLRQVQLVAPTDASVLITGESGTGKELIARAIHEASKRHDRPMIRVNCAAVPHELFESEFFGHVKGAFTGALRDRIGRFELAHGGTLFLDEVGEIPLSLQSKLLRVLQEGHFERVGEERTREVSVRVIAATNRDLKQAVQQGRFREDLYFRLNVFPIESIPLRERREDIPLLVRHFIDSRNRAAEPEIRLTDADIKALSRYDWPGNVRELQNVIERATILAQNGRLRIDLPGVATSPMPRPRAGSAIQVDQILTAAQMRERERANIAAALAACNGKVAGEGGAAERLAMNPTTLASRIKALGLR